MGTRESPGAETLGIELWRGLFVLGAEDFARRRIHEVDSPAQIAGNGDVMLAIVRHRFGSNTLNQISGTRAAVDKGRHAILSDFALFIFCRRSRKSPISSTASYKTDV